jgi:hypothetical protein
MIDCVDNFENRSGDAFCLQPGKYEDRKMLDYFASKAAIKILIQQESY